MTNFPVPAHIAHCPYCKSPSLWVEIDEWDSVTRQPTDTGTHVSCAHEEDQDINHDYMPYVYWLPVQQRIYHWLIATGYVVPEDPAEVAEKLRAWNAGEPIRVEQ
jgi:hypothetical protein